MLKKLVQDFSISAFFAGFIAFLVGISVSSVLVIQAAQLLGANQTEIGSWFWALGLSIGLSGLLLSWKSKYPVATSWSTAGLALIIASGNGFSLAEAIGAFILCGLMTAILGFLGVFEHILKFLPVTLTSAMLAGVLLKFGIHVFTGMETDLSFVLLLISIYIVSKKALPRYCIVITVLASFILAPILINFHFPTLDWSLTQPVWTTPSFTFASFLGIAFPLLIINMASQYLPGLAMIKSYGYTPNVKSLVGWTGIAQTLFAPFGAFSTNIAAISAAICLDEQSHPDPNKRYMAGIVCGACYIVMGLFAATLTTLLLSFPQLFITTLAGIALFATIGHHLGLAFQSIEQREAALMTFLFSASGIQFFGVGSAFWGLLFGYAVYVIFNIKKKIK